jgi:hypothetical protein
MKAETAPQRHVLPQNLRHAVKQLNDGELDELFEAAFVAKLRNRMPRSLGADSMPSSRRASDLVMKQSPRPLNDYKRKPSRFP